MDTISAKVVTLAGGLSLPYAETGDPGGIPVVFVHGYVESWRYFELVLEHLPPAFHGYAPTLRGHGDADEPDGYTPGEFAADVLGFLDAVGLERPAIVGASSGGLVAQLVASSRPHRVSALVLLAAPAALADKPGVIAMWEDIAKLEDPVDPTFVEEFVLATSPAAVPDELVRVLVGESLKVPARVWRETLRGLIDADLPVALERITAPTLLIWGGIKTSSSPTTRRFSFATSRAPGTSSMRAAVMVRTLRNRNESSGTSSTSSPICLRLPHSLVVGDRGSRPLHAAQSG